MWLFLFFFSFFISESRLFYGYDFQGGIHFGPNYFAFKYVTMWCFLDLLSFCYISPLACYLSPFRLMFEVRSGADLGLDIFQIGQRLVQNLQLPLGRGRRLGRGPDHRHLLLLEDAERLGRVAARGA